MLGPMILGLTVTQLNTLFDDIIAWWFSGSIEKGMSFEFWGSLVEYPLRRGCVSHLNVAQRLYQMPLGVMGISLATAIFPVMSAAAVRGDHDGLRKTISKGVGGVLFIALPATVGLMLVSRPLVFGLFENGEFGSDDALAARVTLMFYAVGLTGFFAQQILTRAFYSLHDSKVPARSAVVAVFLNIVLNLILIWPLGTGGLALSTAICSYLQVTILIIALRRRLGGAVVEGVGGNLVKTLIGAVIMGLCGFCALYLMRGIGSGWKVEVARLGVIVPVCVVVYGVMAKILKNEMLSLVMGGKKG
jgi:putative peptidoglycan lipid II flippase